MSRPLPQPTLADASVQPSGMQVPDFELDKFKSCLRRRFRKADIDGFLEAAAFAARMHAGQLRHNGSPYIVHPLAVAEIISDWLLDKESVIAALLHDVVEDTPCTIEDITKQFGANIAQIVDGVSKIERIEQFEQGFDNHEQLVAENYRKMLLAISEDWRVILIKLADRLNNMRTLGNIKSRSKRRRIARETLDIYAPIAERLGFQPVLDELQSLSFEHSYPVRFAVLRTALERSNENDRKSIPKIKRGIYAAMRRAGIKVSITARNKSIYSVYRKMIEKDLSFSEVDDMIGFRLIVPTRLDCYTALGVAHEHFRPVPEKLKDYISQPKVNGYQSLHTTVLAQNGNIIELQIRTKEMDSLAEYGVAAHWHYKTKDSVNKANGGKSATQGKTNRQLGSLFAMSRLGMDPGEFIHNLRLDLYPNDIFVMTPMGKVIQLIKGSTALDMAYAIHTDLGDKANYATINGKRFPVSAALTSGDIVHIETSDDTSPNPQWLSFVATPKARSHIRNKLKQSWSDELVELGKTLLDRSVKRLGHLPGAIDDKKIGFYLRNNSSLSGDEEFYSQIALGIYHADVIVKEILGPTSHFVERDEKMSISLAGDRRAGITRAYCCQPLPPEKIVGVMKRNKGLIVHRRDCAAASKAIAADHYVSMHWGSDTKDTNYRVSLSLQCTNRKGLLANVLTHFSSEGVNIVSINLESAETSNPVAFIDTVVEVNDALQIERFIRRLNRINGVKVSRAGTTQSGPA